MSTRDKLIEGSAESVENLAPVIGPAAKFVGSNAMLTGCEATSLESVISPSDSKILSHERTTASLESTTDPVNNIKQFTDKTIFPMNSLTTCVGKTMPSTDGMMLFHGFLRIS